MDTRFPFLTFKSKAILSQAAGNLCCPFGDKLRYFLEASTASWPCKTPWELDEMWGFPRGSAGKESACNVGDLGLTPGLGRSPGEGIGYALQYSWASLVAQLVKNLIAMQETWTQSLG